MVYCLSVRFQCRLKLRQFSGVRKIIVQVGITKNIY